ncbi:MAG: hypothetical protein KQI81_08725 [Deltaproteobacteria bacterium]|nr:hypothetical protein [Deltaproteobacteria bacterium]
MKRTPIEEVEAVGAMTRRELPEGKRTITLRADERKEFLRKEMVSKAVVLFLDLEQHHTWKQIAEELEISMVTLKELTKSKEFVEHYNAHFAELGTDPRLRAARAKVTDLLPKAVETLENLLTDSRSPTVQLNAAKEVIRLNGLVETDKGSSDRSELAEFLKKANVAIGEVNMNITPPDFQKTIEQYQNGEFIEAQYETLKNNPEMVGIEEEEE